MELCDNCKDIGKCQDLDCESHECPYAVEIDNNYNECTCCPFRTNQCNEEI